MIRRVVSQHAPTAGARTDSSPDCRGPLDTVVRRAMAGFTLLEITLALGLTTMLMAAVYAAMSMYWTTALESYDEIQRAQIARAVLRDMARDIQSCTFIEQETMSSSDDDGDADDTAVDTDTALGSYTNGLFGTSSDLVLYVSRPDRDQNYISAQDLLIPSDRSSDAMVIRYLLAVEGGTGVSGQFADQNPTGSLNNDPVRGLARMQGDLSGLSTAINDGDIEMQLAATRLLAAEVGDVRFQYFDGVDYLEEWDSTVQNAMPLAVVVELTLRTLPDQNSSRAPEEKIGFLQPTVHRLVVPIAVAKPYVGESAI